jgi:hypothetical protein
MGLWQSDPYVTIQAIPSFLSTICCHYSTCRIILQIQPNDSPFVCMNEESLARVKKVMSKMDIDASKTIALHNFPNT